MSAMLKLIALTICLNTFMYIGIAYANVQEGVTETSSWYSEDLFAYLMKDRALMDESVKAWVANSTTGMTSGSSNNFELVDELALRPEEKGGSESTPDTGGFSLLDGLKMIYAIILTIFKIAVAPLLLFTVEGLPVVFVLIFGIPLTILQIIAITVLIRGGGAI